MIQEHRLSKANKDTGGGEEGEGKMHGEKTIEIYKTTCNRQPMGICSMTQGTQTGALQQPEGWDEEEDGREGIWVYPWMILVDVYSSKTFTSASLTML